MEHCSEIYVAFCWYIGCVLGRVCSVPMWSPNLCALFQIVNSQKSRRLEGNIARVESLAHGLCHLVSTHTVAHFGCGVSLGISEGCAFRWYPTSMTRDPKLFPADPNFAGSSKMHSVRVLFPDRSVKGSGIPRSEGYGFPFRGSRPKLTTYSDSLNT